MAKHGHDFFYITPFDFGEYHKTCDLIFLRLNDMQFYKNFQDKFKPVIERMKLNKEELRKYALKQFEKN